MFLFPLLILAPADKPMTVECGITDILGRPTNPPPSTTPKPTTTTSTTTTPPTTSPSTTTAPPTTSTTTSTTTTERTTTSQRPSTTTTTMMPTTTTVVPTTSTTIKQAVATDADLRSLPRPTSSPEGNKTTPALDEAVQATTTGNMPISMGIQSLAMSKN